ncbi:uncharacterized protein LOC107782933 isoform X2 [Nicotiana tabacum]|uniref:Uncharacterized protein LOC107782933 isoform X2 n=1 Tax=Nicotiana tabacum TaxID=4097 RepID=A0A1S3Z4P1_TOBAC|nr:uncharacterized protein LOC104120544 isoform X2 [Nicotiana tomentosiformis]XP_016459368.1 PREDICTED: uncharacterized protein LOC107782933 isoform X2 [Nicotiana tabacum]
MERHLTVTKPSRSDEVLDEHQQLQITNQVKALFDAQAPKRLAKPNRSEPDSVSPTTLLEDFPIPELDNLRSLQTQGGSIFSENSNCSEQEEFVETRYYNELVSIDKQHHTTGSGFIKMVNQTDGNIYNLQLNGGHENGRAREFNTNPARNDWIPSSEDYQVGFTSSKPNRSESD